MSKQWLIWNEIHWRRIFCFVRASLFSLKIYCFSAISVHSCVNAWLDQTLKNQEEFSNSMASMLSLTSIAELHQRLSDHVAHTESFIAYLQNELHQFHSHLDDEKLSQLFQPRLDTIEYILYDRKLHSQALMELLERMLEIDQLIDQMNNEAIKARRSDRTVLLEKWQQYKDDFNQLIQHEYWNIQPRLDTRLELAIRTLDADLDLMEHIFWMGDPWRRFHQSLLWLQQRWLDRLLRKLNYPIIKTSLLFNRISPQ